MKKIYQKLLLDSAQITNDSEKLTYLTSILRSILQLAVVTSFEITKCLTPHDESDLSELSIRFQKPADGLPLQIINNLTPFIRSYVDKTFLNGWFEVTKNSKEPLSKQIIEWVEFRNKRPGHGVLDTALTEEWAKKTFQIITNCMSTFSNIIPTINDDGSLYLPKIPSEPKITSPVLTNGHAIVIMSISARQGIWKLKGQLLSLTNAEEFTKSLPEDNVFSTKSLKSDNQYKLSEIVSNGKDYSFFHNIPTRQTDTFEGRQNEIALLKEWLDDKDSRYCLVYGDGGFGKTTLVIELLNQIMESQFNLGEPIPSIISYHTAKMTKWTEEGLTHFTSITPVMDECLRELMRCFYPILPAEWYGLTGRQLIDKSISVLKENKFTRDDLLLVIDNTETLATSPQEVKDLGAFFKQIGKLVGRLIITSRRREFIEATPIVIEGLSELECVNLMKRLADEYQALPVLHSRESKLRKVANQLMRKPILLEALVKYISRSKLGVDAAIENVFKKTNEDLLEFLYEDAWLRMSELQKHVFLTIININSPLEKNTVSKACQEIGIQHTEFQAGLEETHFAVLTDYGRTYSIELVDLAKRFFLQQFSRLPQDKKHEIKSLAMRIDKYAAERNRVEKEYRTDRVAEAFRSEYAKAAKVYADKGNIPGALEMYKLALDDDPLNSALHDRFSWLILNKTGDYPYAVNISKKAVELDENNCDALVGLALALYRMNDLEQGDKYIDLASTKGRTKSFCLLRKSIARYHKARDESDIDSQIKLLETAEEQLSQAQILGSRNGGYDLKNSRETVRYQNLTKQRLATLRAKRTRAINIRHHGLT